MIINHYWP